MLSSTRIDLGISQVLAQMDTGGGNSPPRWKKQTRSRWSFPIRTGHFQFGLPPLVIQPSPSVSTGTAHT